MAILDRDSNRREQKMNVHFCLRLKGHFCIKIK